MGSDLDFQRRWWKFERSIWVLFSLVIVLDVLGFFGRGPVAKGHMRTNDGSMDLTYERVERFGTPSIMTIQFGKPAVRDRKIQLWAEDKLVKELGNQRIVPQPAVSQLDGNGLLYTFAATSNPNSIEFALQPASAGIFQFTLRVPGMQELKPKIYIVP